MPTPALTNRRSARFQVRRDHNGKGRPEGWYVEDMQTKAPVERFRLRIEAQALADRENAKTV